MNTIFTKLGYYVDKKQYNAKDIYIELLSINNPDGTIRWIWNAQNKTPIFLKFYNVSTKRSFLFATLIKLIFIFKLQRLFFKKSAYFFSKQNQPVFDCQSDWALFMGTVGLNNKAILYANQSFYKIATTRNAQELIQNEHSILQQMNAAISSFNTPQSMYISEYVIQLSDISDKGKRSSILSANHYAALQEMSSFHDQNITIADWKFFQNLKQEFSHIKDERLPNNMLRKMQYLLGQINESDSLSIGLSQGDFTQWNMFETTHKLSIYDWELASMEKPKGYDYFHFIIQTEVLVNHSNWKKIYAQITKQCPSDSSLFGGDTNELNQYLKYYLLVNGMQYLKVYAEQKEWHIQIEWLLSVWNEALNMFMAEAYSLRDLLIMDLFDAIQNKQYATLKFPNELPEKLSVYADIDMLIPKELHSLIFKLMKNHALVSKITTHKKSFMNTIQVFTNDGSILSLDLIWQLKRRNLVFMDIRKVIGAATANAYGVKSVSAIDNARYVLQFFILNGAAIPPKYWFYEQRILHSFEDIDYIIKDYFLSVQKDRIHLISFIKNYKQNRGVQYISNTISYAFDTIKKLIKEQGFTITFSGVDGAGKSTVIENIAEKIEKQLRKPVVVLRHRPSILPILSVWTKGKKQAHQDTLSQLPRQGSNQSLWSSIFRFSYYYIDYLVGQFVIYFKYILRGYVVIYDRYYFDFINDSKRSNIILPKPISRFGYHFLLKPQFNFFLFADADTILNRKKELSRSTIENLTKEYKSLFHALKMKGKSSVYESIHNQELEVTLNQIVRTIISA